MPRCLVARNGWVCAGGELGTFSAFRVGDGNSSDSADMQPDDRLPPSLDLSDATSSSRSEKSLLAPSNVFGKDRVNCITLWFPPTLFRPFEGAYDQDVAVLANNDSSILTVGLRDMEVLDKVTYPDFMNRGVLSPDGRLLIGISDDPYLYIHERKAKKPETAMSFRPADRSNYEWSSCGRIQLKSQSKDDRSDNRLTLPSRTCRRHIRVANCQQRKLCGLLFQHREISRGGHPVRDNLDIRRCGLDRAGCGSAAHVVHHFAAECGVWSRQRHGVCARSH